MASPAEAYAEPQALWPKEISEKYDVNMTLEQQLGTEEYERIARHARWKIDLQVVPVCLTLYLLSFLDRTNIGQGNVDGKRILPTPPGQKPSPSEFATPGPGISTSLGLTQHDYAIALTVLYTTYIAFEIPSNLFIKRVGAGIWIPTLVSLWGVVSTLQGIVSSKYGLYINRIFLGLCEAGVLPGIAVYLTFFYRPHELQLRQALFFTGASLSGAFSGLLATAIRKMNNITGLAGWQWVFILEGIATVVIGVMCFWLLPSTIDKCKGLSELEKRVMSDRITLGRNSYRTRPALAAGLDKSNSTLTEPIAFNEDKLWLRDTLRTFKDPAVWILCCIGYCLALVVYSLAYFGPSIVQEMRDYTAIRAMLMSCPPYAISFVYSLLMALVSDYFRLRIVTALPGVLLSLAGYAVMYSSKEGMTRYGGLILATAGAYSVVPALFSWLANNSSGHYKRATSLALLIVFTNSGGLTSSWLFPKSDAKSLYHRGNLVSLILQAVGTMLVLLLAAYYLYERKQRESGKRDHRVFALREKYHWTDEQIRLYLGDEHPEYMLEL